MISLALGALRRRLRHAALQPISIPPDVVERTITANGAEPWHVWGIVQHAKRGEAAAAMRWILANVEHDGRIFETACGCAANLLWLSQQGYRRLMGAEISSAAVATGKQFADSLRAPIELWQDDSLSPSKIPEADVVVALNWTYLRTVAFDMPAFIERYGARLAPRGLILMDAVDRSFDGIANNEHQTDDWHLPAEQRRPTQYKLRMSGDDVRRIAADGGFDVIDVKPATEMPPRFLYVLRKRGS